MARRSRWSRPLSRRPAGLARPWAAGLVAALALAPVACGDAPAGSVAGPSGPTAGSPPASGATHGGPDAARGGPGLAVYGIGQIRRAIPNPCPDPGHREFDFWVGLWNVENPDTGDPVGTSAITSELEGCVVLEDFMALDGFRSRSLSVYDADLERWFQRFASGNTTNIRLSGGLAGGDMVMTASQLAFNVGTGTVGRRDHRVTWSPNPDGTMDQTVEVTFQGEPLPPGRLHYVPAASLDRPDPLFLPFCQASVIPGFRELDFWLGSWRVSAEDGPELGRSRVVTQVNDCLIVEDFETPEGSRGYESRSYLFYDFVTDTWFRTFADKNGEHLELSGGLVTDEEGSRLVMTGTDVAPDGREVEVRVTLAEAGPGRVTQTWEVSHDGGRSWRTDLSLVYTADG